jgi:hypothetical protein
MTERNIVTAIIVLGIIVCIGLLIANPPGFWTSYSPASVGSFSTYSSNYGPSNSQGASSFNAYYPNNTAPTTYTTYPTSSTYYQNSTTTTTTPSTYTYTYPTTTTNGGCYVGGCNSEICSDQPNAASSCLYSPVFACFRNSQCTRQANGQCGWTQTQGLTSCLNNAR